MRLALALAFLLLATASHAEIAVVAGRASQIAKLNEREVADIFLAKTSQLADGHRVNPLELRESGLKESFYRVICGKSLAQVNSYWTTLIFTGKGKPPRSIEGVEQLIARLNSDPQAIGYLPLDQVGASMKVLHVLH